MDKDYSITINNKRIFEFYQKNPNINFEAMNLIFLSFECKTIPAVIFICKLIEGLIV